MDKKRWNQLWFGLACFLVVGYGALMFNVSANDTVYREKNKWELEREIEELQQKLAGKDVVYIERMASPTKVATVAPILKRLSPRLNERVLKEIDKAVIKYSEQYKIPPVFVVYLMKRESNFNPRAFSSVGAVGLMQVFPKWHLDKMELMGIRHEEVYDIDNNVRLGCWILRNYINQTGSIDKALTKYVGGKHEKYVKDILVGYANEMIYVQQ